MSEPEPFTVAEIVPSAFVVLRRAARRPDGADVVVAPRAGWHVSRRSRSSSRWPIRPVPVQVSVNVVVTVSALLVRLPLVAFEPDQPPDAVHDVAFVLLHVSCVVPPLCTLAGDSP